jgi:gamma-glutamylaminecyclotransferase
MTELKNFHKVFVYGSLKGGFGNHGFLETSEFLGTTCTAETDFVMFSFGHFPGVVKHSEYGYGAIEGEVYLIDDATLFKLDLLEGNGRFYTRRKVKLDEHEEAWMYLIDSFNPRLNDEDEKIAMCYHGDKLVFSWQRNESLYMNSY